MALQPVSFRWDPELVERIDAARGDVPRSTWVRRQVERALGAQPEFVPASTHNALVEAAEQASGDVVVSRGSPAPAEQISEEEARQLKAATQFYPAPSSPYPPVVSVRGRTHAATCKCPVCSS